MRKQEFNDHRVGPFAKPKTLKSNRAILDLNLNHLSPAEVECWEHASCVRSFAKGNCGKHRTVEPCAPRSVASYWSHYSGI